LQTPVVLDRRLTPFSVALFGLAYICPTVVISTFGVLARDTRGTPAAAYGVATVAILFTAISYGRMAARFPEAGSAYTYVSRTTNVAAGFVAGWVLILDYFFVPMVICLFTAKALEVIFPALSYHVWVALIAAATTAVNILGIKVADRVNLAIMTAQLAVIAALIVLCLLYLRPGNAAGATWSMAPLFNPDTTLATVMSGAAIAAYSFLGFDAVSTLSEETLNPQTSIPRATIFAAGASGVIYIVTAFLMALVHPSLSFHDVDNGGYETLELISGRGFSLMLMIVLIAYIASVMCAQAGSSRLLYVMGRDGVLPRVFAQLHPSLRTPVFNIGLMGAVMLTGEFFDVETAASCVNFGAFTAFMGVNLCVLVDHIGGRRQLPGGTLKVLQAAVGAAAACWLIASLHTLAQVIGFSWLALGALYVGVRTRGFRQPLTQSG
jgi:putrescine importer